MTRTNKKVAAKTVEEEMCVTETDESGKRHRRMCLCGRDSKCEISTRIARSYERAPSRLRHTRRMGEEREWQNLSAPRELHARRYREI